jgi:hypothetical protein
MAKALKEFDNQRAAQQLLQRLARVRDIQMWCYVQCVFRLVDPKMLGTQGDTLWIGSVFDDLPIACQRYINKLYRESLENIRNGFKRLADDF